MTNTGTMLFTKMKGELVGEDANGNKYYQARKDDPRPLYNRKRWVIYKGDPNPLTIAPEWFPWLQYIVDEPLKAVGEPVVANETGTPNAYFPDGDERRGGRRPAVGADIQPWQPKD